MHELTMATSILGIVVEEARKAGAEAVRRVRLCVGDLAGVEAASLWACFELLAEGTVAERAELVVRRVPVTVTCMACGAAATGRGRALRCPACGPASVRLVTGRELYVESIDVEGTQQG